MVKRGNPGEEDYVLIPAGQTVSNRFDLHRAYDVSRPGEYDVSLDTEVQDFVPANSPESLSAKLKTSDQQDKVPLEGDGTQFVVEPGDEPLLTEGQMARKLEKAKKSEEKSAIKGVQKKASPKDPEFNGGSVDEQDKTKEAHTEGYALAVKALNNLSNDAQYKEWFGAHTNGRFQTVKDNYTKIKDGMESETFTYDLTGSGCKSGWFAYTYKGTTTIWMCGAFWNAPATGTDSKAGTVVHEHSHASASTDDLTYGQPNCRKLATDDPDKAVRNADNHEYYAGG